MKRGDHERLPTAFPRSDMNRRHDLDWVRVCAFALLVIYHVGMYYVSWDWHVKSPQASHAIEPLMVATAPWRLSLLFMVSGVATAFLLARGEAGFLGSRSWRLLLPLLFGMLVIVPPQSYFELVEKAGYADGYGAFYGRYLSKGFCKQPDRCLDTPTWNHLWFVAYLWAYTVVLWALHRLLPATLARLGALVQRALTGPGLLLWPAAVLVALRIALIDRFESTHALVDDWYNHAQYFGVFLLGYLIARATPVWDRFAALRWTALALSVGAYAFLAVYFSHYDELAPPPALKQLQRGVWGLMQWTSIAAVLGFARRHAPGDSPALRYLSQAVFPVYILHQTLIVVLAHELKTWGLAPRVEGPLLIVATLALCFAGYELVRRVGWLRPLFGLRRESKKPAPAVATTA